MTKITEVERVITDEENARTAMHVESTQSFQEALFVASRYVDVSYQIAEHVSVAAAADPQISAWKSRFLSRLNPSRGVFSP